jgi:protein-S-isoprenylcysteine O-methyltransferase Ste14
LSVWLNSLWLLITVAPAVALISVVVIPREERFLERNFGDQYSSYMSAVRRWF